MQCTHPTTSLDTCTACGRVTALSCDPQPRFFKGGAYKEGVGCCAILERYPHAPDCRFASPAERVAA